MTYEQFLDWDGENQHVEWVNGEVVEMAPVGYGHQDLGGWLIAILRPFVNRRKLGVILFDPFQMKTGANLPGRAPDVLFLSNRNFSRLKENYVEGPADLVVEIVSPGSRQVDREEKLFEYEAGGVKEFWLIDPQLKSAEFYRLGKDGKFHLIAPGAKGVYRSVAVKGFWLRTEWLWSKPLPDELEILAELGIV